MLTLTNALNVEGYTVFRDDVAPNQFYVLPRVPDIATDDAGKPLFSLIVYRRDDHDIPAGDTGDVGGGILTFTSELTVAKEELDRVRHKLRALVWGEDVDDDEHVVLLDTVPFLDGKVSVGIAGETGGDTTGNEFVKKVIGEGSISGIGGSRKAIMARLSQAGAALLSQIGDLETLPINVDYKLSFEHRLLGVTLHVWCNLHASYEFAKTTSDHTHEGGYWDLYQDSTVTAIASFKEEMIRSQYCGAEVVPSSSQVDQETIQTLQQYGLDLLSKRLDKAIDVHPPTDGQRGDVYLKEYSSLANDDFNFTLREQMVLTRDYDTSVNLAGLFAHGVEGLITFVDLRTAFFERLEVPIRVNADFVNLPLDSVTVTVTYDRKSLTGSGTERITDSYNFTDASAIKQFAVFANRLDDLKYDWSATVHFKGSTETYTLQKTDWKETFLVVDVGALGLLQAEIGLGLVDVSKYPAAKVSVRYTSHALGRTLEDEFKLSAEKPTATWIEVIREVPTQGYEYKVDWQTADGDIVEGDWTQSTSHRLRLDGPSRDRLRVTVSSSGDFKTELRQILVALEYRDPDDAYTESGTLAFSGDGQVQTWEVDLRNPELRDYWYRYSLVSQDGMVQDQPEDGTWLKGEPGFLVVGPKYGLEVEVHPFLLTFPDYAKAVEVTLTYPDRNDPERVTESYVFNAQNNTSKTWRVRTRDGIPKHYTAQIVYYSSTGQQTVKVIDGLESNALLLPPLPPPPAGTPTPPTPPTP